MRTISYITLLLILLLSFNASFGQKLKGKVKSYRDSYFGISETFGILSKGIKLEDSAYRDQYVVLNETGNVSQVTEYNHDESVYCTFKCKSDYKDNHVESMYVMFSQEARIDRKPFLIETVNYHWGEWCAISYRNDSTGLPAEEIIYDLMGRELFKIRIKRDAKGNPVEYHNSNGTIDWYKYDIKGNRVEWITGTSNGAAIIRTYKYDVNGDVVEEQVDDLYKANYHFYNEVYAFVYQYDKHGNWIKRIDYEQSLPKRMVQRTIDYLH